MFLFIVNNAFIVLHVVCNNTQTVINCNVKCFCVLSVMHSLPVSHCTAVSDKLPTQVEVIDDDISVSGCQPHKESSQNGNNTLPRNHQFENYSSS